MPKLYERTGSPYWYAEISVGSTVRRVSTGVPCSPTTKRKAVEAAEGKRLKLLTDLKTQTSLKLDHAWRLFYADNQKLKQSTLDHYEAKIANVIFTLKNPHLSDITVVLLRDYLKVRRGQTSDIQIRRELTALSSVLEYAASRELEGAPDINPTKLVRKSALARPTRKPRWRQPAEIARLFQVATGKFWPHYIRLILETGMRNEEALGLLWSEVDLSRRLIRLTPGREKNKKGRVIPLSSTALRTLGALRHDQFCPHVFVNPRTRARYRSIWKGWGRLREKAGLPDIRIHDLRHTFASWTRQSGMAKQDRMDILGHYDEATHAGYAQASTVSLIETMEKHSPSTLLAQERECYMGEQSSGAVRGSDFKGLV